MTKDILKILTAHYVETHNGSVHILKKKSFKETSNQLKRQRIKFHELIMDKPIFYIFVEDKAII